MTRIARLDPDPTLAPRRLARRLTALLAAAATALAAALATAAPARAQNSDDLVRFLLGAAAVAVIVRSLDDRHAPVHYGGHYLPEVCLETVSVHGRHARIYVSHCLHRAQYWHLPQHCHVRYRTRHGWREGYESHCVHAAGYRPHAGHHRPHPHARGRLPAHCELTYRVGHHRKPGYDARCLRAEGFRHLPGHCLVTARHGQRLYDGDCLWDAGWRRGRH